MTRTRIMSSVEREAVPRDAVPGNAVPGDAVPGDTVPGDTVPGNAVPGDAVPVEVIPGDAIPVQGLPGEQLPENAAERRILPVERRTIEDRVQRAGEAVRGPQRVIGAGQGLHRLDCAQHEPAWRQRAGRRRRRRVHGGVRVEQPAATGNWIGENLAAVLPVLLRRSDKERLDLIRGETRLALQ